ncbi:hypothetical protein SAMN05216474_1052 [Lishizhenia tianjinensis]|uniref:Uncharacterized protein n=1 Tax=Lishizhenia tianjinensis TaxID=477690 RepID=A0A1I6YNM9_9FLAO|nr:hypothetical protein [Lishizhenia tianjinensis]SFT52090.1 hypothetical protein SAMN05216474_1052 [Lishizhenia tianjinensis]
MKSTSLYLLLLFSCLLFSVRAQLNRHNFILGTDLLLMSPVKFNNSGQMHMRSTVTPAPNINLGYTFLSEKGNAFGVRLNLVVPSIRVGYQIDQKEGHNFVNESGSPLHLKEESMRLYSSKFVHLSPEVYYQKSISLKGGGELNLGCGLMLWFNEYNSLGELLDAKYLLGANGEEIQLYSLTHDAHEYATPFFPSLFTQLNYRPFHWQDLSLNLRFNYSYFDRFYGSYKLLNLGYTSSGSFTQSYTYLSLGVRYNLPFKKMAQRFNFLRKIDDETGLTNNQLENKVIPGTWRIFMSVGISNLKDRTYGNKNDIKTGDNGTLNISVGAERELKGNWFLKGHYQNYKYRHGWIVNSHTHFPTKNVSYRRAHELSAGVGFRWVNSKNYNYLNVHSSVSFAGLSSPDKDTTKVLNEVDMSTVAEGKVWYVQYNSIQLRDTYTTLNLGISKDFKLSKNLFLSIDCTYHLGLYKNFRTDYYYFNKGSEEVNVGKSISTGSRFIFSIGLFHRLR